jgi:DNA-binding NtrC family response regulator
MKAIKLLIVDDEIDFLDTISERMQLRGFDVTKAPDGYTALELLEKQEFDVVILDLKMAGIDGQEVLRKTKMKNKKTEIIIFTAHGSEEVAEDTMKAGAFCFITKPVDINKLISVINLALDSQKNDQEFTII